MNTELIDRDELHIAYIEATERLGIDTYAFGDGDEPFRQVGDHEYELDLDGGGLVTLGMVQDVPVLLIQQGDKVHVAIARF
jgi:hypothetical protein